MVRYLDDELTGAELAAFQGHLADCADCRATLAAEQRLKIVLKRSRPLYSATEELSARVAALVNEQPSPAPPARSILSGVGDFLRGRWKFAVFAGAVAAIVLELVPNFAEHAQASAYVETAATLHSDYVTGKTPLDFRSNSPESVAAWVDSKAALPFRLPVSKLRRKARSGTS
ncbi:MAG: zf-HC2 domain-containing protein [Ignavibacteriota bacterium]